MDNYWRFKKKYKAAELKWIESKSIATIHRLNKSDLKE